MTLPTEEREGRKATTIALRVKELLGLPEQSVEDALGIFRRVRDHRLVKNHGFVPTLGAALFASCKASKVPVTAAELATAIGVEKTQMLKALAKITPIAIPAALNQSSVVLPEVFVEKIVDRLHLEPLVARLARAILQKAHNEGVVLGAAPSGIAGAAVYLAAKAVGDRRTQVEVAGAAGCAEITIRLRVADLKPLVNWEGARTYRRLQGAS
jgi:transcription initiation factor TFIIB